MCGVLCIQGCYIPYLVLNCMYFFVFSSFSFISWGFLVLFFFLQNTEWFFPSLSNVVITLLKWINKKILNRCGLKLEIAYQVIIGLLLFLLEQKWWNYRLPLRRLKILPANHMYSAGCCKTICSSYPKQVALEIQNGTFPGIYKALPWFLLSTINVCWVIFRRGVLWKIQAK